MKIKYVGNPYLKIKRGERADLGGKFFRSSWEANFARYLNLLVEKGKILRWEYEPDTFWFEAIKTGTRSYTPDFKVTHIDNTIEYFEVKGWLDPKSKTKLKRMKKYYPSIEVSLVDSKVYKELNSQFSFLPGWEK